jgi:Alpha-glutamyl/putrescinyl thymine pyrophosphorylase clade 2
MEDIRTWQKFAEVTIETNDLDPMYQMLRGARKLKGDAWVRRFCMHFLMFYHAGESAKAANEGWGWDRYRHEFDHLQRGTERRHFRAAQGFNALKMLIGASETPSEAFQGMVAGTYSQLARLFSSGRFQRCGFGPYFTWKVLDLQTRVFDYPIDISIAEAMKGLPSEPVIAAERLWPNRPVIESLAAVTQHIQHTVLPFGGMGNCGLQEAETILCMLKGAFITRVHQIGDDIDDKYSALTGYPELQALLPARVPPNQYFLGALREMEPSRVSEDRGPVATGTSGGGTDS